MPSAPWRRNASSAACFAEAVELYESAMQGPLGAADPALLKGLARAQMLSGDGAAAEAPVPAS